MPFLRDFASFVVFYRGIGTGAEAGADSRATLAEPHSAARRSGNRAILFHEGRRPLVCGDVPLEQRWSSEGTRTAIISPRRD